MKNEINVDTEFEIYSNVKRTVGWVLGTATLISAIPVATRIFDFLEISGLEQVILSVALLLFVWTIFSALTIRDLRSEIQRLSNEAEQIIDEVKRQTANTYYGLAFANFYEEPPDEFDDTHYITETASEIEMTDDGWVFREVFRGFNASDQESNCLSIRIDGDSPLDVEDTDFTMYYQDGDEWFESDNWEAKDVGKYSLQFSLYFQEPLAPNESFGIKYESATGAWPTQSEEYIEIPQHRFLRGTERFRATFEFDDEPEDVAVKKVTPEMATSYFRNAERINFEMEDQDVKIFKNGTSYFSQIEDTQASALYILGIEF